MLSLKLQPEVFKESEEIIAQLEVPRNRYINDALEFYNQWNKRQLIKQRLKKESQLTAKDSLTVLAEFERLEDSIIE